MKSELLRQHIPLVFHNLFKQPDSGFFFLLIVRCAIINDFRRKTVVMDAPHTDRVAHLVIPVHIYALAPVSLYHLPILPGNRIIVINHFRIFIPRAICRSFI